jgi:predicted DNA-binding antitoxin AbrB/MazE fold protein
MVYRGHVEKGVVVLDDPVTLPEGSEVKIELSNRGDTESSLDENGETLGQKLLKHAGKAVGLPPDLAVNHDHYLYGTPKK